MNLLRSKRAGVTSVEFAVCASTLCLLYAGLVSTGVLGLTAAALQSVAQDTARCVALASSACPSGAQYAVSLAQARLWTNVIQSSNVTVTASSACNGTTGTFVMVQVNSPYWVSALASGFQTGSVAASGCFPIHT